MIGIDIEVNPLEVWTQELDCPNDGETFLLAYRVVLLSRVQRPAPESNEMGSAIRVGL